MKAGKRIVELSMKKKIVLAFAILAILIISAGIVFASVNERAKLANSQIVSEEDIPAVNLENTYFDISETEETNENVTITVSSKLEDYNLYYYIENKEALEEAATEEESEIEIEQEVIEETYLLYQDSIVIETNSNVYFKYELDGKYSENAYVLEINNIKKEDITEAPENEGATEEELKKEKVTSKDNKAPYYVVVNYGANVVTIYGKDDNNEYTRPVKAMVCSTGSATPRSGVYKLKGRRSRWRPLFGGVYGQYAVDIVGNILFHSVPYLSPDISRLEYWEYDKLGTTASAGCIRLTVIDALWIYNNCGAGTQVEFTASAPSPLGKPSARKISSYENLRGYDPTDPAASNPWRNANISTDQNQNNNNQENNKPSGGNQNENQGTGNSQTGSNPGKDPAKDPEEPKKDPPTEGKEEEDKGDNTTGDTGETGGDNTTGTE